MLIAPLLARLVAGSKLTVVSWNSCTTSCDTWSSVPFVPGVVMLAPSTVTRV